MHARASTFSSFSSQSTTLLASAFTSDVILVLTLLVIFLIFFISTQIYTLSDLRADIRAIIHGDTFRSAPSSIFVLNASNIENARERARAAFARYGTLAHAEASQKRKAFGSLSRVHRRIATEVGYVEKLDRLEESVRMDAGLANAISAVTVPLGGKESSSNSASGSGGFVRSRSRLRISVSTEELNRVREAMKHFVRDWSSEGEDERRTIFAPVLGALKKWVLPMCEEAIGESGVDVLIPGSGLGRLAWEVHQLGLTTTALELSPYMSLAFRFLASSSTTQTPNQHRVHPYAYWFSHQRSNTSLFRAVSFPDVVPRLSPTFRFLEADFLSHTYAPPASSLNSPLGYASVITLFFLDTSSNVLSTLQRIYRLLRPGGMWINLGPLLWHSGAKLEPCLEEVWGMCMAVGFEFLEGGFGVGKEGMRVKCEYTRDKDAMMHWVYEAEFWVARKPLSTST